MPWITMRRADNDDDFEWNPMLPEDQRANEVWVNGRYQCLVRYVPNSDCPEGDRDHLLHLSIHSHDRGPMRNWRHLQQIKNEVAGELRTAVEIFPAESKLTDTANEYHLWVMPTGEDLGFGLGPDPLVSSEEMVEKFNAEPHPGRQEPWEEGLTTGKTEHSDEARENYDEMGGRDRPPRIKELPLPD